MEETMPTPSHLGPRRSAGFLGRISRLVGQGRADGSRRGWASANAVRQRDTAGEEEAGEGWLLAPSNEDAECGDEDGGKRVDTSQAVAGSGGEFMQGDGIHRAKHSVGNALDGAPAPMTRWYQDRNCRLTLLGYGLCAFVYIMIDELLPIFAATPASAGGLSFAPRDLAAPSAFGGAVVFFFSIWGFPKLNSSLGIRKMTQCGFVATAISCMLLPLPSLFVHQRIVELAALYGALGLRGAAAVTVFTNAMMLVNASSPAGQLGEVNGVGQAVGAFVRGFGPELIGLIWSWFIETGWTGAQFGAWAFISVLSILGLWNYHTVPFEELAGRKQKSSTAAASCGGGGASRRETGGWPILGGGSGQAGNDRTTPQGSNQANTLGGFLTSVSAEGETGIELQDSGRATSMGGDNFWKGHTSLHTGEGGGRSAE